MKEKLNFNTYKKIEKPSCILTYHNGIRLDINKMKLQKLQELTETKQYATE